MLPSAPATVPLRPARPRPSFPTKKLKPLLTLVCDAHDHPDTEADERFVLREVAKKIAKRTAIDAEVIDTRALAETVGGV